MYKWETHFYVAIFFSYEFYISFSTIVTESTMHDMSNDSWMMVSDLRYQP